MGNGAVESPYPSVYDIAYARRNILQYLLAGVRFEIPHGMEPSAAAERIMLIADEVVQKAQARGWLTKLPEEPKAE